MLKVATALMVLTLALNACTSDKDADARPFAERCATLANAAVATGKIVTTAVRDASGAKPQACVAQGEIVSSPKSTIKFQLELPVDNRWNKKMVHLGGGGFNGVVITADTQNLQTLRARERGYVIVGSDSGHQNATTPGFSFALDNPVGFDNFLFASIPQVQAAALSAVQIMYGSAPAYRYFYGASTGGREALQQAQRFAQDYDGVVALEPVLDYSSLFQKATGVVEAGVGNGGAGWISPAKVKLISNAVLAACDPADGLKDGIISDSEDCTFDLHTLRCPRGTDAGNGCLSDPQLATARDLRTRSSLPVPLANGLTTAPAFGVGAETDSAAGWSWLQTGSGRAKPGVLGGLADGWLKYGVTSDVHTSVATYRLGSDAARWKELSIKGNATNPDLGPFAKRGGKLILWHGWSDHLVMPGSSIDYYQSVVAKLGQSSTDDFLRFYMTPGVTHGNTGPGATEVDFLTALENWVEQKQTPPDALDGARYPERYSTKGTPTLTRPVCRYPSWPKYHGKGNPNLATSFSCALG
jgi:hypothetical protein